MSIKSTYNIYNQLVFVGKNFDNHNIWFSSSFFPILFMNLVLLIGNITGWIMYIYTKYRLIFVLYISLLLLYPVIFTIALFSTIPKNASW